MKPRPARQVACPQCGRHAPFSPENPWRPFCCERCRLIDLGNWANESYRVPTAEGELGAGDLAGPESDVLSSRG